MKKILLIEDDEFIRDLVSAKLVQNSFEVLSASSAEEAVSSIDENMPDLLILDLELPEKQGVDFLRELRHSSKYVDFPIIVFSNNDEPEIKEECEKLGITSFFVKINTDLDELVSQINSVLS